MTGWVRAGLVAAIFAGAPSTTVALLRGHDVLASTEAVGSVLLPAGARRSRIVVGGVIHILISLLWARVIAEVFGRIGPRHPRPMRILAGSAFGLGIAALDLGVVGRHLPSIRALPAGPQIADHVAYGALVAWAMRS